MIVKRYSFKVHRDRHIQQLECDNGEYVKHGDWKQAQAEISVLKGRLIALRSNSAMATEIAKLEAKNDKLRGVLAALARITKDAWEESGDGE